MEEFESCFLQVNGRRDTNRGGRGCPTRYPISITCYLQQKTKNKKQKTRKKDKKRYIQYLHWLSFSVSLSASGNQGQNRMLSFHNAWSPFL